MGCKSSLSNVGTSAVSRLVANKTDKVATKLLHDAFQTRVPSFLKAATNVVSFSVTAKECVVQR